MAVTVPGLDRTGFRSTVKPPPLFPAPSYAAGLDETLADLHDGDLVVVGGRPAAGCTSLLLSIAARAIAGHRQPVAIFSAPYSAEHVRRRLVDLLAGPPETNAPGRGGRRSLHGAPVLRTITESHLLIDDRPVLSVEDMATSVFRNNIQARRRNRVTVLLNPDGIKAEGALAPALRALGEIYGGLVLCRTTFSSTPGALGTSDRTTFEPNGTALSLARASSAVLLVHAPFDRQPRAPRRDECRILLTKRTTASARGVDRPTLGV